MLPKSDSSPSKKQAMDVEEKARLNTEKFKLHGADHLGDKISN